MYAYILIKKPVDYGVVVVVVVS